MRELKNGPPPDYTHKSETESTCISCGEVLQVSNSLCLKVAEEIHSKFCIERVEHPDFHHELAYESGRTLILSTCLKCGDTDKCSIMDDSIGRWEHFHRCTSPPAQMDS